MSVYTPIDHLFDLWRTGYSIRMIAVRMDRTAGQVSGMVERQRRQLPAVDLMAWEGLPPDHRRDLGRSKPRSDAATGGSRAVNAARPRKAAAVTTKRVSTLAELVKTEPTPPVDSAPPATPKLHPPTHKSAEGLRIARQKAAEATRAEVPKQAQTAPVAAPAAPAPRGTCQYPLWGDRERSDPERFCNAPPASRDVRGVPVQSPYCQKHHDICYTKTAGWGQRSPLHEVKRADPAGGDSADAFLNPS